ncbi:hypothetical protein [Mycoplana ramosa]|uniref:Uncharacterized protein n=1 Tax=Mycoplana ramosa TaxID=40837 RepID=A0ABW3YY55_MYCRA
MGNYEQERVAALDQRRKAESRDRAGPSLEERFGPGTFGCHEALHVTHLVVDLIERELVGHSAVLLDPAWYQRVREAQALLYTAYSAAAQVHFKGAEDESAQP